MSTSPIFKEIEQKQKEVCQDLVKDLYICGNCRKHKPKLFICKWINCVHSGRILCKRCGAFVHDPEETDHEFDLDASHIEQMSTDSLTQINDDPNNKALIKQRIQEMQMTAYSIEEKQKGADRAAFFDDVAYGINGILQLEMLPFLEYTDTFFETFSKMAVALKSGAFKEVGNTMSKLVFNVSDEVLEYTKVCHEGALVAAGVTFSAEFLYQTYQLIRGNIGWKQYGKKVLVAAAGATAAAVGNIGGTAVGTAIGTIICPGIGSSIGGAIGGLLGALFFAAKARQSVEDIKYFNDIDEQKKRMELINDALIAFGFNHKDITNQQVFNKKTIAKKYRTRAMEAHPDRCQGNYEKFHALNAQMAILLALLEKNDNIKTETAKSIKAITL